MQKRKLIGMTAALCLVCSAVVYAAPAIVEKIEYANAEIQPGSLTVKNNLALRAITKEQKDGVNVQTDVEAYAHFLADLCPTEEEIRYVDNLIGKGYDAEAVIEIYEFWQDTQEDLSIIEAVYAYRPAEEDVRFWVDEGFIKLAAQGKTKNQYSNLSVDEVKAYYESGLSYEEIMVADKLSRHGTKDIKHVLERKQKDISWYEIMDEVYTLSPPEKRESDIEKYKGIKNPDEIFASIRLAETGETAVEGALDAVVQGESSSSKMAERKVKKGKELKQRYVEQGIWNTGEESKEWDER